MWVISRPYRSKRLHAAYAYLRKLMQVALRLSLLLFSAHSGTCVAHRHCSCSHVRVTRSDRSDNDSSNHDDGPLSQPPESKTLTRADTRATADEWTALSSPTFSHPALTDHVSRRAYCASRWILSVQSPVCLMLADIPCLLPEIQESFSAFRNI